MFRKIYDYFASLDLGIWLMFGVIVLLGAGSFLLGSEEGAALNEMPLLHWLLAAPFTASWWLWLTLVLLALLALNTVLCSIDSMIRKRGKVRLALLIAPHLLHLGFLVIMLAHLVSSTMAMKQALVVREGDVIGFPGGGGFRVQRLWMDFSPMGMPTAYGAELSDLASGAVESSRPNAPVFLEKYGIYVKQVAAYPERAALLEIHHEPGAPWALAGAIFFSVGNVMVLAIRRGQREEGLNP